MAGCPPTNSAKDEKERLFRDEAGAAVEKAVRLEDENARLRAEVELLRRGGRGRRETSTVRTHSGATRKTARFYFFVVGAIIGVVSAFASTRHR